MHLKRAIPLCILVYIISFASGIMIATILGVDLTSAPEPTTGLWIGGMIATVIIMSLFTVWYFKSPKTTANAKNGFYFGLVAVLVGSVIDAAIIVPMILTSDAPQNPIAYYTSPLFTATIVILLITTTVVGVQLEDRKRAS